VLVVPFDPPTADNEEVSRLELHTLFFGDGFEICYGCAVTGHGVVIDTMPFGVSDIVEEDVSADDATTLAPVYTG
jgi:hypothetical protein